MPTSQANTTDKPSIKLDVTTSPEWQEEQMDRLLGFEILHLAITANPGGVPPAELGDKIGVYKGYSHEVIKKVKATAIKSLIQQDD